MFIHAMDNPFSKSNNQICKKKAGKFCTYQRHIILLVLFFF